MAAPLSVSCDVTICDAHSAAVVPTNRDHELLAFAAAVRLAREKFTKWNSDKRELYCMMRALYTKRRSCGLLYNAFCVCLALSAIFIA